MNADAPLDWRQLHIEHHTRTLERGDDSPEACAAIAWWELRQPYPDFPACIEAMVSRGIPVWEAARIIGRVVENLYPLSVADSRALDQYVINAYPSRPPE